MSCSEVANAIYRTPALTMSILQSLNQSALRIISGSADRPYPSPPLPGRRCNPTLPRPSLVTEDMTESPLGDFPRIIPMHRVVSGSYCVHCQAYDCEHISIK